MHKEILMLEHTFTAKLWKYGGNAPWYFVTLPTGYANDIKTITADDHRGFGSVRVTVRLQDTRWQTSIFPDSKTKSYLLPLKKEVRTKYGLQDGDRVTITLRLVE